MSNLYGIVRGAAKTPATRRGHKHLETIAASYLGAIHTELHHLENGDCEFTVTLKAWQDRPIKASGVISKGIMCPDMIQVDYFPPKVSKA